MSVELHRDTPIWEKSLVVRQCQGTADSRTTELEFRIIPGTRAVIGSSGQSERLIHFEITDENDPYFLYVLDIGEQDFHLLKHDQALLVEFPVFPKKMMELLNLCLDSEIEQQAQHDLSSGTSGTCGATDGSDEIESDTEEGGAPTSPTSPQSATPTTSKYIAKLDTASGVFSVIGMYLCTYVLMYSPGPPVLV